MIVKKLRINLKMPGIIHEKLEVPYWLDILKRLPNARGDWRAKRPLEKFCYLYGIGRMAWDPIALPVFQEDQTLRFFSFFAFTYTLLTTLLMFYTLIWYGSHGELEKALPCTCLIVGVSSSVRFKLIICVCSMIIKHKIFT